MKKPALVAVFLCNIALTLTSIGVSHARDLGQWEQRPPHVREWFQKLTQPDNPRKSCCGEADAYEADYFEVAGDQYVAIITNGAGDERLGKRAIPNGTRFVVPNHKLKWDDGNPTAHGFLFLDPN